MFQLAFLFLPLVVQSAHFCTHSNILCVRSSELNGELQFEVEYKSTGWAAIGFGNSMSNAKIVMMYTNENGVQDVTLRTGMGRTLPQPDSYQEIKVFSSTLAPIRNRQMFGFALPLDTYIRRGGIPMIYAFNTNQVIQGNLQMHHDFGTIPLIDLYSTNNQISFGYSHRESAIIHGILMFVTWYFCASFGVFVARFMKVRLGSWWIRVHGMVTWMTIFMTIANFIIMYMGDSVHFNSAHSIIGVLVLALAVVQGFLGIAVSKSQKPNSTIKSSSERIHMHLGRVVYFTALINIFLGINSFYEDPSMRGTIMGAYGGLLAILFILFLIVQRKSSPAKR
jgi:hypothetical protein